MSLSSKKLSKKTDSIPVWMRHLVAYLYGVGLFSIGAAIVLFMIAILTDQLFSYKGLFLTLYILTFVLLLYLRRRFKKDG